jgi:hypothetical protein
VGTTIACCANGYGEWGMACNGGGSANYEAPNGTIGDACPTATAVQDVGFVDDGDAGGTLGDAYDGAQADAYLDHYEYGGVSYYTDEELDLLDEGIDPFTFEELEVEDARAVEPSDDRPTESVTLIFGSMR